MLRAGVLPALAPNAILWRGPPALHKARRCRAETRRCICRFPRPLSCS